MRRNPKIQVHNIVNLNAGHSMKVVMFMLRGMENLDPDEMEVFAARFMLGAFMQEFSVVAKDELDALRLLKLSARDKYQELHNINRFNMPKHIRHLPNYVRYKY